MCEISIVVPVFNTEAYLRRCIDSILNQSFSCLEIILVEDGSSDNSAVLCDDYRNKDKRIQVIHQHNSGLAMARKNGLDIAQGKYVMFIDSDDWIDMDMLDDMYEIAVREQADVVCSQYKRVNEQGRTEYFTVNFEPFICRNAGETMYHMHVTRYINSCAVTKLIKRTLLSTITFCDNLAIGEEHDMVCQLFLKASKVIVTDRAYYNYFTRRNSISHSGYNDKYNNSLKKYIQIEKELEDLFPEYKRYFRGFYAEYEMAVITAMCRNKSYDWNVIRFLRGHLRKHLADICKNAYTVLHLKFCAIMITYLPRTFIILFRGFYLMTGR